MEQRCGHPLKKLPSDYTIVDVETIGFFVDTLTLCRRHFPHFKSHSLANLSKLARTSPLLSASVSVG